MKRGLVLIILGVIGIVQYVYFQFTPLVLKYTGRVTEQIAGMNVVTEILWTRDWTIGIVGLLIGLILLSLGTVLLVKKRQANEKT